MKGKVTKDIFLRVGQGVMRIPRDTERHAGIREEENSAALSRKNPEDARDEETGK